VRLSNLVVIALGAVICTVSDAQRRSSTPRLSEREVDALVDSRVPTAPFLSNSYAFSHFGTHFDPATRVWDIDLRSNFSPTWRLRVFVYDATSRVEVACLGMVQEGTTLDIADLPSEVSHLLLMAPAWWRLNVQILMEMDCPTICL
jgi:hypothetical protein